MSGAADNTNTFTTQPPPAHHIHRDSEVLPGATGAEFKPAPYETSTLNNPQTWRSNNEKQFGAGTDTGHVMAGGQHSGSAVTGGGFGSSLGEEDPSFRRGDSGYKEGRGQATSLGNADPSLNKEAFAKHNAFHEDRPMGVQPTSQGGVAIGGKSDLPEGHASVMDKMVGKTQKVAGKVMKNPAMHEKGELRETGGKQAVTGDARAAHD
ncbi:hypothetical protein BXZ70DRAFT_1010564 [Cristinia sonorae]|uniref:Uncharacterized protein n=1 Tax=Cristinia sonorae TaxID=1940300 RepID=A0A8K0UJE9_9AGAR|nr:hypothetical protein BXZ70DRAFT_1010564 [Cristinia sonorae]